MWWLVPLTFLSGCVASYLVNTSAITVITHRVRRVIPTSVMTNGATWLSLYIVGKVTNWSVEYIIATAIGDIVADFMVTLKFPRPVYDFLVGKRHKKPVMKKIPKDVTTA